MFCVASGGGIENAGNAFEGGAHFIKDASAAGFVSDRPNKGKTFDASVFQLGLGMRDDTIVLACEDKTTILAKTFAVGRDNFEGLHNVVKAKERILIAFL